MADRPWKPCPHPGCGELVKIGKCPRHAAVDQRATKVVEPFYKRVAWRKLRAWQLRREPLCARCGRPATVAHHREEIRDGGAPLDQENLESLCASCHSLHHHGRKERV